MAIQKVLILRPAKLVEAHRQTHELPHHAVHRLFEAHCYQLGYAVTRWDGRADLFGMSAGVIPRGETVGNLHGVAET